MAAKFQVDVGTWHDKRF